MRGKPCVSICPCHNAGLIPAHAGKTFCKNSFVVTVGAHPRACGENKCCGCRVDIYFGSSPRMRGKPMYRLTWRLRIGLIPAHAGKTTISLSEVSGERAHPRACGENVVRVRPRFGQLGSSPRMRGKPFRPSRLQRRWGLIPAHAGKTIFWLILLAATTAHPRACGEND